MTRDPLPPFLLSEVHTGDVQLLAFAGLPDALTVKDLGHSVRCTGCGRQGGASAHPHHRLSIAHLRQTGQRHRLPYWTSLLQTQCPGDRLSEAGARVAPSARAARAAAETMKRVYITPSPVRSLGG